MREGSAAASAARGTFTGKLAGIPTERTVIYLVDLLSI